MEFKEGMSVKTANGEKVGTINQIVVDPTNQEITHIIVQKGFLFTEDRVIPVELLTSFDKDTVTLHAANLDEFPEFVQSYYVLPNGEYSTEIPMGWATSPLYYYPPVGVITSPYYTTIPDQVVERVNRNIPPETVAIGRGTGVTTLDGDHAEKLIPISWITTMNDEEIRLDVSTHVVEDLPEYHKN